MPLSNRAPIDATGKLMVTTLTPNSTWPVLGGMTYHPTTGELAVIDAVPAAGDPTVGGIRFTNLGSMYVTSTLPSPIFYVGGLPVSSDGRLFMSSNPPIGSVGGWPVAGDGGISGVGLSPQPIFFAPLTNSLVPTTAGNPTFTFSRATLAYAMDFEGILRQSIANEARFQGARRVANLTRTPITPAGGWTVVATGSVSGGIADPLGGNNAYQINMPVDADGVRDSTSPNWPAGTGVASVWLRADAPGTVVIMSNSGIQLPVTTFNVTTAWQRFASAPATGAADGSFYIRRLGTTLTKVYAFQPQFESVSGQSNQAPGDYVSVGVLPAPYHGNAIDGCKYFATRNGNSVAGNVVTEATGAAIPTATLLGYVAENAATNLCLQSQTFDNAAWSLGDVTTPTPNSQVAPDGTVTGDVVTVAATTTTHSIYQGITGTAIGTPHTLSVYAKAGTGVWLQVAVSSTAQEWANFNVSTGVVGFKSAGATATITALANGWYRCSVSMTPALAVTYLIFSPLNANTNSYSPSYAGTGQTMYLWGAQVEASSDVSSYIPTTTVSVIRNTDDLKYQLATNIDGTLATTYAECYFPTNPGVPLPANQTALLWQGGYAPQYYASGQSGALSIVTPAGGVATVNTRVIGAVNKQTTAWSGVTASVCLNGGAVGTGAFTAFSPASGTISVGAQSATQAIKGSIRNVRFYSQRLTDAELITLTSP